MTRFFFLLAPIIMLSGLCFSSYAQVTVQPEEAPADTVITVILPAAAYTSDFGLVGGLMFNRYRYHPHFSPFVSLAELSLLVSTKGMLDGRIRYDHTEFFGREIRSRWTWYGQRYPNDNYFGIGNDTSFDAEEWDDGFYFYRVIRFGMEWQGRKTVYEPNNRSGRVEAMATVNIDYESPDDDEDRLLGQDRPAGIEGAWVPAAGLGLIWDNRDNEYDPTRGSRFELSGEWAPGLILGDYSMASLFTEYRQFVTIPIPYFEPVLATRIGVKRVFGTIPYWKRPYLGDDKTIRGYPVYRFRGDASVFYNIELRTWIFEYPLYDFKLGIHGFHDGGRVFYDGDRLDDLFNTFHRTFGGGFASSLFTPDFIVRLEIGFSEEMYRLYVNIGYMF